MSEIIRDKNFLIVSYAELWHKINYYGIQSILVLFLTKQFGIADSLSYTLYGIYTALSFGFGILGGVISDKVLNIFYTAILGCLLIFVGSMFLGENNSQLLYLGLSFTVVGFGFIKPCTPGMIGQIYSEDLPIRNKLYSLFYLFANVGSIAGPLLYGMLSSDHHYQESYFCGAIGILSASLLLFFSKKMCLEKLNIPSQNACLLF